MKCGKATLVAGSIFWMCALVFGISLAHADSTGEILKATPDQVDLGKVPEGEKVVVTATLKNTGSTPVEITNVRTS